MKKILEETKKSDFINCDLHKGTLFFLYAIYFEKKDNDYVPALLVKDIILCNKVTVGARVQFHIMKTISGNKYILESFFGYGINKFHSSLTQLIYISDVALSDEEILTKAIEYKDQVKHLYS